ncbi:MAG: glycosyltransferase [Oligoflexales bacterium]|nr:glycosyltransferase [Oligoflexales bacterium]
MKQKKRLLFYAGSCHIIGGDSKYLFDLINHLDPERYEMMLYADENHLFEKRASEWLRKDVSIKYLPTLPEIFAPDLTDLLIDFLERSPLTRSLKLSFFLKKIPPGENLKRRLFNYFLKTILFREYIHSVKNFLLFVNVFRKENPDIFFFNNGGYPGKEAGIIALLAARLMKIPKIVMSFHNIPPKRGLFRLFNRIYDIITDNCCNVVIAASENLRQDIIRKRGISPHLVHTIYCGIEDRILPNESEKKEMRRKLDLKSSDYVLGICGNLDEDRKGHTILFDGIAKIVDRTPDIKLLVIGGAARERIGYLKEYVKKLGIADHVRFLNHIPDVHSVNCIFDVAVVPSCGDEATPYTIKEGARAGKPVITTTAGGCLYGIADQKTGLLVDPGNPDALARAVLYLYENRSIGESMGFRGRSYFLENFLLDNKVREHEALLS